jgi:hypothetical protein
MMEAGVLKLLAVWMIKAVLSISKLSVPYSYGGKGWSKVGSVYLSAISDVENGFRIGLWGLWGRSGRGIPETHILPHLRAL